MLQIVWLQEKSETVNRMNNGLNCCIRLLIDHITNGGEELCGYNLEML
jgi:hypothetical protein